MTTAIPIASRYDFPLLIDGKETRGDASFPVRYPYTGETIGSAPKLSPAQVTGVLEQARDLRFDLSRHQRAQILNAIADRLAGRGRRNCTVDHR